MSASKYREDELILDDVSKDLLIDRDALNKELLDSSLLLKKYGEFKTRTYKKYKVVEQQLKNIEEDLFLRAEGKNLKEKECRVGQNQSVRELRMHLIDADAEAKQFANYYAQFLTRHEAIKELCANVRKELV